MNDIFIHPTAVIDDGAVIGRDSRIWHFAHVMSGAVLGESCNIGQNAMIASNVRLGNNVKVQNNVSVYEGVLCEDDVFLGPSCVFTNVKNPRSEISRHGRYEPTVVRRGATVGANATVVCGVEIGSYALVGAGAVVTHSVPAHAIVVGTPARCVGWACRCGHRLAFDENGMATCPESGHRYRKINNIVHELD